MLGHGLVRRVQDNPGCALLSEAGKMVSGQCLGAAGGSLKLQGLDQLRAVHQDSGGRPQAPGRGGNQIAIALYSLAM